MVSLRIPETRIRPMFPKRCPTQRAPRQRRPGRGGTAARRDGVRVFRLFVWLEVGSVKVALSRPAHATRQVTRAVGQT